MDKLSVDDLYTLEAYARLRPEFRQRVLEHKAHRKLALGDHVTLLFEDRLTMQYQVQEMLRAERVSHGAAMSRLDDDLQRLRKANAQLQETVEELRKAVADGLPDAELLNRATEAELEAIRAARATDAAEAHAVLARLEPLLTHANLAEGEVE